MTGEHDDELSGPGFWLPMAAGTAIMGFGVWGLLHNLQGPALTSWLKTVAGALILHDAIFAPLVVVGAFILARVVPGRIRAPVQGALIVSGALIAVSIPVVGGYGRLPSNPSLLPSEHYGARLLAIIGVVWAIAAVVAIAGLRRPAKG